MLIETLIVGAALLSRQAAAQSSATGQSSSSAQSSAAPTKVPFDQTSTFFSPGVPTDAPIPGNYTGSYRPQVHYSPPQNFMNDPNGMFR